MPTYYVFNILLFFLATLSRTSSLNLGTLSLSNSKPPEEFQKASSWAPSEFSSPGLLKDSSDRDLGSPEFSNTMSQESRSRSRSGQSRKHQRELSNEIDDSFKSQYPLARYLLVHNVIPRIPLRPWHEKEEVVNRHMEKLRKIKAIKEALRLLNKKQREKMAFLKAETKARNKMELSRDRDLPQFHRQMKFRRAKPYTRGHKFRGRQGASDYKQSIGFLDNPLDEKFALQPDIPYSRGKFGSASPVPLNGRVMFQPQTTKNGFNTSPNLSPPYWSAEESPKPFIPEKSQLASYPPSSKSDVLDFRKDMIPDSIQSFDPMGNSGGVFVDMPASKQQQSTMPESPSPDSGQFQDGFHSFPASFRPNEEDIRPGTPQNGFSTDDVWGDSGFVEDNSDCYEIDDKLCQSDADCSCYGFYTCIGSRCRPKQSTSNGPASADQSRMDGWLEKPVDFGFSKRDVDLISIGKSRKIRAARPTTSRASSHFQGKS